MVKPMSDEQSDEELAALCEGGQWAWTGDRRALYNAGKEAGRAALQREHSDLQRDYGDMVTRAFVAEHDLAEARARIAALEAAWADDEAKGIAREKALGGRIAALESGQLDWVPFEPEDFPEGNTALFRFVGADGADYYFVDRITWDSESPPQWDECSAGIEFDEVTHYALFNQLESQAKAQQKAEPCRAALQRELEEAKRALEVTLAGVTAMAEQHDEARARIAALEAGQIESAKRVAEVEEDSDRRLLLELECLLNTARTAITWAAFIRHLSGTIEDIESRKAEAPQDRGRPLGGERRAK